MIDGQNVVSRSLDKPYGACRHVQPILTTLGPANPPPPSVGHRRTDFIHKPYNGCPPSPLRLLASTLSGETCSLDALCVSEYCEHHHGEPLPINDEADAGGNRKRMTGIGGIKGLSPLIGYRSRSSRLPTTSTSSLRRASFLSAHTLPLGFLIPLPSDVERKTVTDD